MYECNEQSNCSINPSHRIVLKMALAFPFDLGPSSALHMQSDDDNGSEATDDSYDSFQDVLDYEAEAYRQLFVAAQSRARRRYAETGGLRPSRRRGNRRRGSLTDRNFEDAESTGRQGRRRGRHSDRNFENVESTRRRGRRNDRNFEDADSTGRLGRHQSTLSRFRSRTRVFSPSAEFQGCTVDRAAAVVYIGNIVNNVRLQAVDVHTSYHGRRRG